MRCVSLFGVLSRSLKLCCVLLNQQMWVVLFGSAPFLLGTLTLDGASLNVDGCVVASHLFSCDASVCDLCSPLSVCSSSFVFSASPRFAQPCRQSPFSLQVPSMLVWRTWAPLSRFIISAFACQCPFLLHCGIALLCQGRGSSAVDATAWSWLGHGAPCWPLTCTLAPSL